MCFSRQIPSGGGARGRRDLPQPADEAAGRLGAARERIRRHRTEDIAGPRVRRRVAAVSGHLVLLVGNKTKLNILKVRDFNFIY